jgi:ABC-type cobalamin/Fe3+-siderophores transport system ATPase subunit
MLTQIQIENYRGFQSYRMDGLARVNLLVGKNGQGKTALLECIQFLVSGGDPAVLFSSASRRGEEVVGTHNGLTLTDISHFFHGHLAVPSIRFKIKSMDDSKSVIADDMRSVSVVLQKPKNLGGEKQIVEPPRDMGLIRLMMAITPSGPDDPQPAQLYLMENGAVLGGIAGGYGRASWERVGPPVVFIEPDSFDVKVLATAWASIVQNKKEGDVYQAMRLLRPDLEDIYFLAGEARTRTESSPSRAGVFIGIKGGDRRVPLGSLGDGMRRLLSLAISLAQTHGGVLLIDEIDTGLHYSIMAQMWELVVRTAERANIQVFATTHSADCIRGLGVLCKHEPDLCEQVAVHKIVHTPAQQSICFQGADVIQAVEQDIELR